MTRRGSRLDGVLPTYDFSEQHSRVISATPPSVYTAFRVLTPRDMPVSWLLFGIRSLPNRLGGRRGLPSQLDAPLLDQFLRLGFTLLDDVPGEELIVGMIGQMWRRAGRVVTPSTVDDFMAFAEPGFVKAAMTFRFTAQDAGATLAQTETRVLAIDAAARRGFARYWFVIRGFSGLIRRDWLRAVARRATSA